VAAFETSNVVGSNTVDSWSDSAPEARAAVHREAGLVTTSGLATALPTPEASRA
jgi:hypothetical protein